jgi:hypothetical protein
MDPSAGMPPEVQQALMMWSVIGLLLTILGIVVGWKIFVKAGEPGWGILIPIYNIVLMCRIGGRPGWWAILFFIPVIWFVPAVLVPLGMAKNFGKGVGFAIALMIPAINMIPLVMLAFGDVEFSG